VGAWVRSRARCRPGNSSPAGPAGTDSCRR
jgi:hypothetical protein